jgi:cell wall-associated NlpC family hydrolase
VAFSELRAPYGWGGRAGERDCSSFLRDALSTYGIQFARHSGVQAELGTDNVDLQGLTEREKLGTIEHWAGRGVVLLYMPGHIMLYLGADGDQHYAISAMSEYLEPCEGGADTVHRIDSVAVTTLEIGRDTERTAFIERLTRLVAFAPPRASARAP